MAVSTGTVGSGSKIKYVSYGSSDTLKDIFDAIAGIMTGSGGWTLASGTSGTFYTTYYSSATSDFRRVYSSPLIAQGSGLTTKYVMLRICSASGAGNYRIQLIPFGSWNSGTDVGTNQAGVPLVNNQASTYGNDCDFIWSGNNNVDRIAPSTMIATGVSGLIYVAFDPSAAYLMLWPYYISGGAVYNGLRNQVLMYGEIAEDFTSYTNVPPVYVTTLQRLSTYSGMIPSNPNSYVAGPNYWGANNSNIGSFPGGAYQTTFSGSALTSFYYKQFSPGPMWLMPVSPGSTTGFTGVADTVRTGPQASAFTRMTLGHLGEWGYAGGIGGYNAATYVGFGSTLINGTYYNSPTQLVSSNAKYSFSTQGDVYQTSNTSLQHGTSALNSTNLKGIEPMFSGGTLSFYGFNSYDSAINTAYNTNPFPILWSLGRIRGLKFVGSPPAGTTWSTLDTVSMTVDSNGFFVKTGGTSTSFALVGAAPFAMNSSASYDPAFFFAIPS